MIYELKDCRTGKAEIERKTTVEIKEGMVSICSMLNKNGYGELYFGVQK